MPKEWYDYAATYARDDDSDEDKERKEFNRTICAHKKPYFFAWNYDMERINYNKFVDEANAKAISMFGMSLEDIRNGYCDNESAIKFAEYCNAKCPLDLSPSTMNRICWKIEKEFSNNFPCEDVEFDYNIYKSSHEIKRIGYCEIKDLCKKYVMDLKTINACKFNNEEEKKDVLNDKDRLLDVLIENLTSVCPNENVLCDILLDICYDEKINKSIVWDVCGNRIIENLLERHNYTLTYPEKSEEEHFYCCGIKYANKTIKVGGID